MACLCSFAEVDTGTGEIKVREAHLLLITSIHWGAAGRVLAGDGGGQLGVAFVEWCAAARQRPLCSTLVKPVL